MFLKGMMAIAGLSMLISSSSFAAGPNPNEVYVRNIVHAGTGCPSGTVAGDISADAKAFTLLFDEYVAEAGPGIDRREARKFCQLTVNLRVPQGWSYTLFKVDYAGFADLDRGTYGIQTSEYYFQGSSGRSNRAKFSTRLRGGFSGDYDASDDLGLEGLVWSPCGVNRALNIKTSVFVRARGSRSALMTLDSVDGELVHLYGIKWRRCR